MNEQFQEYLMSILEKTSEFLGGELPEVAKQILSFSAYSEVIAIVSISCVAGAYLYGFHLWTKFTHTWEDEDDGMAGRATSKIVTSIFSLVYIFNVFSHVTGLIKIVVAPKVFLLEYAAGLVK